MPYKDPAADKACRLRNRDKKLAYMRKRHAENRERLNKQSADYYAANRETCIRKMSEYAKAHPEVNRAAKKRYRAKPEVRAAAAKRMAEWRAANPERANATARRFRERHRDSEIHIIANRLRARLHKKLANRGIRKVADTMALTGCTSDFLRGYIEARFRPGMNWNNMHIDHIRPLSSFDLRDEEQQRQAFHYQNLQPLFAAENLSKGSKPPTTQTEAIQSL